MTQQKKKQEEKRLKLEELEREGKIHLIKILPMEEE